MKREATLARFSVTLSFSVDRTDDIVSLLAELLGQGVDPRTAMNELRLS